ncbi:MAG TPA: peptidylprolyl isomerase [Arenimonas sp.]|uniref:peptidylprolyl isomerase n=1 Tax=Arenimonas sp. TaxID=1872635 RepID=UPI002C819813|nr:peptidylprolyl isomerase [Arenimonas sp.]HMB56146.1 peptidylprolyl isomerase [Arenimonas sp.]
MKPIFPFILAGLLAAGPAFAQTAPTTTLDGIAAVVDEDVILRSELDRAVANITAQYASQPGQLPPRDILEKQVLERLILMHLQIGRAADSGIQISDAELQQAVAAVAGQNKMTVDQLRQRLAAENLNFDEFRNNLRDEVTVQRLRQRYIQSKVTISEAEIDQLLATQKIGGEELRLANIQIALPDGATPDQIAVASKKVLEIKGMVERGELDFHSAAIRFSQGQNALDGGELGWRTYDAIPPLFASVLRGMKPGQITDPVRGPNGFQIVQLEESRQPQPQKITQFKALDILVRTSELVNAEAARQKIQALRDRIAGGEDFAKVAKEASEDTLTRNNGGDMGWFVADQWGTSVSEQIKRLADGELSPIFQSDIGFHLIKRVGSREQDVTDENRRNQAREIIGNRKGDEEYERFLRQIRSEAYVETRLGS